MDQYKDQYIGAVLILQFIANSVKLMS